VGCGITEQNRKGFTTTTERSCKAMSQLKTARGDLSKGSSGVYKKSSSNDSAYKELQDADARAGRTGLLRLREPGWLLPL
jgi:hypothetical protein